MRSSIVNVRGGHFPSSISPGGALLVAVLAAAGAMAGWGVLNFPAVKVLAVGLGVLSIMLAAWKIEHALLGVAFLMVVIQEAETAPGTLFTLLERLNRPKIPSLLEVLFAVIIAAFAIRLFVVRDERYTLYGMKGVLGIYLALLLVAWVSGIHDGNDHTLIKEDLKRFVFPPLFFASAINVLDSREKIVRVLSVMFGAMFLKTLVAIFYYVKGLGFPYGDSRVVFLESGDQILTVTALVIGVSFMGEGKKGLRDLLLLMACITPMLFALMFSYRRNALWGAILSLGLLMLLSRREKRKRLFKAFMWVAAGVAALMVLLPMTGADPTGGFLTRRLVSVVDRDESSNKAHVNEWVVTAHDTMQRPLFGLGLGSEHAPVPEFEVINRHTVHNALLMLWMKMGSFALIIFIWCFYRYVRLGVRESLRRGDAVLTALFATCALWFVSMNVGPAWFYYRDSCLIALFMAMVIRLSRLKASADDFPSEARLRPTV